VLNKIQLQINTGIADSEQVLSWFEQLNQPLVISAETWWQCQTLLQEGFMNIVEHAHKNLSNDTPIDIEAARLDTSIEIRIWSYGERFNMEEKLQEIDDFEANDGDRGRGLKIMSALADRMSYEQMPDRRYCLFLSKSYQPVTV
jgi:serine/threonine-protein kinase RsbW